MHAVPTEEMLSLKRVRLRCVGFAGYILYIHASIFQDGQALPDPTARSCLPTVIATNGKHVIGPFAQAYHDVPRLAEDCRAL
jgi:hypothetical protein